MWRYITILMGLTLGGGVFFFASRVPKFLCIRRRFAGKRSVLLVSLGVFAALGVGLVMVANVWNGAVITLHYLLIWALADAVAWVYRKLRKVERKRYISAAVALSVTTLYLAAGWFCCNHVFRTAYSITTTKALPAERIRIVCFSDSHVGTTFHWQQFTEYVDEMNAEKPDLVVITGDYVDDDTSYEDMVMSCRALSRLETTYGVYYVFGNHDAGYYGADYRGYGRAELVENLEKNGVIVLQDQVVRLEGNLCLAGRNDQMTMPRQSMDALAGLCSPEDYLLVLDHEPGDYEAQAAANVDLVLSGHTHGGQFIPITHFGEYMGVNDSTYGLERRGNTDFIVTSGISNWAFWFKTGCISEYVVIDLTRQPPRD